jgi:hypothetical protein
MKTISELVQRELNHYPFLMESLHEGLINVSALARNLQPIISREVGKQIKEGAIVMAINRLPAGGMQSIHKEIRSFARQLTDIRVRSSLLDYTFINSASLIRAQAALLSHVGEQPKAFCTYSQGVAETTIVISSGFEQLMEELFSEESLIDLTRNLSAVSLMLPATNRQLHGIYYYILKDLAWQGINVIELISTSNEFTIIVRDEDLDQTFSILMNMRKV